MAKKDHVRLRALLCIIHTMAAAALVKEYTCTFLAVYCAPKDAVLVKIPAGIRPSIAPKSSGSRQIIRLTRQGR